MAETVRSISVMLSNCQWKRDQQSSIKQF